MRKILTTVLTVAGLLSFSAGAVNYLPEPTSTAPVNGSFVNETGDLKAEWEGIRLTPNMEESEYTVNDLGNAVQRRIKDGYKYVSIEKNGETLNLQNDSFFDFYINDVSQQNGVWSGIFQIYPPLALYSLENGDEVSIHFNEGIAKDATGNVTPAINYSFTHFDLNETVTTPTFDPVSGSSFDAGKGSIIVTWEGYKVETINKNIATKPIFMTKNGSNGDVSNQVELTSLSEITEDGSLKLNIPPTDAGSYNLTISEGAVAFDDKTMNKEYVGYTFTINESTATYPSATVTPATGATLTSLEEAQKVTYSWEGVNITLNEKSDNDIEVFVNEIPQEGFEAYLTKGGVKTTETTGDGFVIDLSSIEGLAGGVYNVILPMGYVLVSPSEGEGEPLWNEEVNTSYTVLVAPTPQVSPASGAQYKTTDNLTNVTVSWPGCYFTVNDAKTPSLTIDGQAYSGNLNVTTDWTREEVENYVGNVVTVNLSTIDIQPGEYVLTIPAGYVNLAGPYGSQTVESQEVTVSFTVISATMSQQATQVDTEVAIDDPYAGIELTWPEEVSFVDPENVSVPVKFGGQVAGTLTADNIQIVPGGPVEPGIATLAATDRGETMFLLLSEDILTQKGQYTISLPEGLVENSLGQVNTAQDITFLCTVLEVGVVTSTQTEFTAKKDVVTFTITFADATEVKVNESAESAPLMVYSNTSDVVYDEEFDWEDEGVLTIKDNTIVINLGSQLAAGSYSFSLREGAVLVDGMKNGSIDDYAFSVVDPEVKYLEVDPTVIPDPKQDSVEPFTVVSLTWPGYSIELNKENTVSATFDGEDVEAIVEGNSLLFRVEAAETKNFSLVIPVNYVVATSLADDETYFNKALTLVFAVDADTEGIVGIAADANGFFNVVNINGVKVLSTKDASAVKNLAKGIYIINGKKVVVR